jgi:2-amino-4-hydroxy-6-hydroxymethyldihydropteridine diphosphokinase
VIVAQSDFLGWIFVALGSNLGNSPQLLENAFDRLQLLSTAPLLRSSLWRSAPLDCPPGSPDFVNAVAALLPAGHQSPQTFLVKLQELEKEFGRLPKKELNEARPLDLDIILWNDVICQTPNLTIPHPRARERRFVMEPLAEIAPKLRWPGDSKKIVEICRDLRSRNLENQTLRRL